jgi:hypothetical protein
MFVEFGALLLDAETMDSYTNSGTVVTNVLLHQSRRRPGAQHSLCDVLTSYQRVE